MMLELSIKKERQCPGSRWRRTKADIGQERRQSGHGQSLLALLHGGAAPVSHRVHIQLPQPFPHASASTQCKAFASKTICAPMWP